MEDDSDDDDDSYFNHLQEAANRLDDEGNENEDNSQTKQSSKNQKEFKNDNEYYDQIQQECGQESNIISSGNNMVWQSLLRNVTKVDIDSAKYNNNRQAFQCIDLVYDKDNPRILLVEQWLLSQLPISSYALSRIRSRYLFPVDNLTLWVDDFLHPSTLILAKFEKSINKDFSGVSYAFSSHLFSALPSVNDLKPLLVSFLPVLLSSSIGNTPLTEVAQQQQVDQPFEPSSIEWESIEDRITYVMQDILNNTSLSRSQIPRKPLDVYTYVVYVYQGPMEVLRADPNAVSIKTGYQLRKLT